MRATPRFRRRLANLYLVWAVIVGGIGVWNLLDHISGPWVTVLSFVLLAIGIETFFFQRWLARRQERGHFANPS